MNFEIKDSATFRYIWKYNGLIPEAKAEDALNRIDVKDALSVPNAQQWLPQVIEELVREGAEPLLVGTSLLERIEYKYGQTISFPSVGALTAADIPEGAEYPERTLQVGPGTVIATIGKSGLAVKITEEMMRYSQYDVINMHLRAAGRALARHKEKKIWDMFLALGVTTHDNTTPASSVYGSTTGRSFDGTANGSLTMDDLFEAYGMVMTNGYVPDTIVMHPLTWTMFIRDPIARAFALNSGGGTYFAGWNGSPVAPNPWPTGVQGAMGPAQSNLIDPATSPLSDYPQTIQSSPKIPGYFPFPLRIVVSPFVPYNPTSSLTDVIVLDSANAGAIIVDEDPSMDEVPDKLRDITKIKVRERYALAVLNEGNAIATIKDVKVAPNEIVVPQQSVINDMSAITRSSSPL